MSDPQRPDLATLLYQRLEQQQVQLDSMTAAFTTLLQRQALAAETQAASPLASTAARSQVGTLARVIERPPTYDGKDRAACSTFINQIKQYFRTNPTLFASDSEKIDFTVSYLRGKAFKFVEPHLERREADLFGSFATFCDKLITNLGDPDLERSSEKSLRNLTQTGSASAYSTEFFRLAGFVKWNDEALQSQFRVGLKPDVKRALIYSAANASSAKDLSDLAIRLDNGLYEVDHERPRTRSDGQRSDNRNESRRSATQNANATRSQTTTTTTRTASSSGDGMDLDSAKSGRKFQPLTPQQKKYRMDNGLCLYCGKPGHVLNDCPVRAENDKRKRQLRVTFAQPNDTNVVSAPTPLTPSSEN